jgi:tetratricopeptide (TPR) repeat protein|tara:strand:+ start:18746 stop:19609 length:864 start_codon:yes stop_codon:yes gene_type:complete
VRWLLFLLTTLIFAPGVYAEVETKQVIQQQLADGSLDSAENSVEEWVKNEPGNAEAWHTRGVVMAQQAQNAFFSAMSYAGKSVDSFEKAVELAPDSIKYRRALMQFYLMAPSIAGGDDEKALAQIEKMMALDPAQGALAKVGYFRKHEKMTEAESLLEETIAAHPNNADVLLYAGLQKQRAGEFEDAFKLFDKAKAGVSEDGAAASMALYQIGKTAVLAESQLDSGITALDSYLEEEIALDNLPEPHWAQFRKAQLLALKGDTETSEQLLAELKGVDDKELQKQLAQ